MDNLAPEQERDTGVRRGCPHQAHTHAPMRAIRQAEGGGAEPGHAFCRQVEAEGIDGDQKAAGHQEVYDIEGGPAPDGHLVGRGEGGN